MKLAITYWQSYQYSLTVDSDEVIPAVRYYLEKNGDDAEYAGMKMTDVLTGLEAGRLPADLSIIAEALKEDGQLVAVDGAEPDSSDEPGDYTVEAVPE